MSFSDSVGHFTSILIYFMLESKLWKATSDVIMTSSFRYATPYGKIITIFGFSVSNCIYLVTFDRKIKFSIFYQFSATGTSTGTQPCKGLTHSRMHLRGTKQQLTCSFQHCVRASSQQFTVC